MEAFNLFIACQTQWRTGPLGGALGLDYPGVETVLRVRRVKDRAAAFECLQMMEAAAIEALNARTD